MRHEYVGLNEDPDATFPPALGNPCSSNHVQWKVYVNNCIRAFGASMFRTLVFTRQVFKSVSGLSVKNSQPLNTHLKLNPLNFGQSGMH